MTVRQMQESDFDAMIAMGRQMHQEGQYAHLTLHEDKLRQLGMHILSPGGKDWLALVAEDLSGEVCGMLVAYTTYLPFGFDKIAQDFLVYVKEDYRGTTILPRMVKQYEEWATSMGVVDTLLGVSNPPGDQQDRVVNLYKRLGYSLLGQTMRKEK